MSKEIISLVLIWQIFTLGTLILLIPSAKMKIAGTINPQITPNFKQKISGCYRIGQYLAAFVIRKNTLALIKEARTTLVTLTLLRTRNPQATIAVKPK